MGGVLLWRWGGVRGGRSASVEVGRGEGVGGVRGWEECFCGGGEGWEECFCGGGEGEGWEECFCGSGEG